jgi:prepilin-type N-terminal cleavage/methylation domain-containing protein
MLSKTNRRGFTLPEVLVTVAIIAVLAAIVVPAVTQQVNKGDAPAFLGSVSSLRTAVASFAADVRKLPGELSQLGNIIVATTDEDLAATRDGGVGYTASVVTRWRGPYESSGAAVGVLPVGMGWETEDDLVDSLRYVVVTLVKQGAPATTADAVELDAAVDGANGATTGIIRWDAAAPTAAKLFLGSSAR